MSIENDYVKTFTKQEAQEIFEKSISVFNHFWDLENMNIPEKILTVLLYSKENESQNNLILFNFKKAILDILEKNKKPQFDDMFKKYRTSSENYTINWMIIV